MFRASFVSLIGECAYRLLTTGNDVARLNSLLIPRRQHGTNNVPQQPHERNKGIVFWLAVLVAVPPDELLDRVATSHLQNAYARTHNGDTTCTRCDPLRQLWRFLVRQCRCMSRGHHSEITLIWLLCRESGAERPQEHSTQRDV